MVQDNKTFYIEKDTNYALQVECATNINFDEIKRIAKFFVMQLPEAVQNKIYNELDRGVNIIDSEPQLNMYLHSFGNMHQAKMRQAFSNIGTDWFGNKEIEIIDYGCGQALATMLYHDYLQANGISQTVSKITLIEPSEKALCRAGLHAKAFYPEAEIHTINKLLNDVAPTDISHSGKPVLHLFSNIIDIEAVDMHHLATISQAENADVHTLWICVSPFFGNHIDNRIPCFLDILNQPKTYTFQRSKGNWQNQWTINCIIAEQKQEENLSTEVTEEDIANCIKDGYGCKYSPDGKRLLKGNKNITSYTVKEETKVICDCAFKDFDCFEGLEEISLQSIVIPESVIKIGDYAFSSCDSLKNIVIPKSVTEIGNAPFKLGIGITLHSSRFIVEDDLLIDLEKGRLIQCLQDKDHIVIPNSVTEIGYKAFYSCKSLQSIVIPNSVTKIGGKAFGGCESLQSIVIPDLVTEIGDKAFCVCSSLQSIVIPDSVTKIGDEAFNWCKSLQSIVIPDSVTSIGYNTFGNCSSLQSIVIPESVTEIDSSPFTLGIKITSHSDRFVLKDDLLIDLEEKRLIQCLKDREHIVIPETVTEIGDSALEDCKSLQSIIIPDSVTKIGNQAFGSCESLQSIVIPDSVTKIGNRTFLGCRSLQNIVIPESLTKIGDNAFRSCASLKNIVIPESVTKIGDSAFEFCSSLQSIVIPESVTKIGNRTFLGCRSLQNIVIPKSVTEIGNAPFTLGIGITLHSSRFIVEDDLLIDLEEKRLIQCLKNKEYIVIPETVTEIGDSALEDCKSLQSIIILDSVTKIGNQAFGSCKSLQSIVIPDSVTEIGAGAFFECESLQSIVIPESVTEISTGAFMNCKSLQSIVIPETVTEIGIWAFAGCSSLQSIVIPDSVTKIGGEAFNWCKSLQSIVVPDSVTSIGYNTFGNYSSLQSIVIPKGKKKYFESILDRDIHHFLKEIDYKKIYNGLGFCYEFGFGYKRDMEKAEEYYAKAKDLEDKEKSNEIICDDDLPF